MQETMLRAEVLRQLAGAVGQWAFTLVVILVIYKVYGWLWVNLSQGLVFKKFSKAWIALTSDGEPTEEVKDAKEVSNLLDIAVIRYVATMFFLVLIGYSIGYVQNAYSVVGDISLIVTVSRITNFYNLLLLVVQITNLLAYSAILWGVTLLFKRWGTYGVAKSRGYNWLNRIRKVLLVWGILSAVVIPLGSIILTYVNLVGLIKG